MISLYNTTLGLIGLLTALSIVLLGITAHLLAWMSRHSSLTFTWIEGNNNNYDFHWVPEHNLIRSYILLLVTGCLCTIISLGSLLAFLRPSVISRYTPRKVSPTPILVACTILGALLILSALALAFTDNSLNPPFLSCAGQWQSCDQATGSPTPAFTIEGWVCPISFYPPYVGNINGLVLAELNGICTEAKVVRWWTLPLLLVELGVIVCGLVMIRNRSIKGSDDTFEKEIQVWGGDTRDRENPPRPGSSRSAAPTYRSQDPSPQGQNRDFFDPVSPINNKRANAAILTSPVSQTDDIQDEAPRYETLRDVLNEAEAHSNQVHEVDGSLERPSQLAASRTELLSELPAENSIR